MMPFKRDQHTLMHLQVVLDVFGMKRMISLFPEVCKPAFVWDGRVRPLQVASMMKPTSTIESMDPNQKRVWGYLMKFVDSAEEAGEIVHYKICHA